MAKGVGTRAETYCEERESQPRSVDSAPEKPLYWAGQAKGQVENSHGLSFKVHGPDQVHGPPYSGHPKETILPGVYTSFPGCPHQIQFGRFYEKEHFWKIL